MKAKIALILILTTVINYGILSTPIQAGSKKASAPTKQKASTSLENASTPPTIQVSVTPPNPINQCMITTVSFQLNHPSVATANNSHPILGYILLFNPQTLPASCRTNLTNCVRQATYIHAVNNIQTPSITVGENTHFDNFDAGFIYFYANTTTVTSILASNVVSLNFQACALPPNAPSNLSAALQGNSSIQLTWTDNSQDELEFKIERSVGNTNNFEEIAQVAANVTTYPNENLLPGTSYYYRVRARSNAGYSPYSNNAGTTTPPQAQTTTSISQYGITWNFAQPTIYGRFVNGDYWVAGPVTITSITPNFAGGRNGFQVNPTQFDSQGYDSRSNGYNSALVPSLPLTINTPSSVVKTISNVGETCGYNALEYCYLDTAAVLTVLTTPPPNGGENIFRPAFAGTQKILYSSSNLQTQLLPSLTPPTGVSIPSLATVESNFQRVQLDYPGWGNRRIHPDQNLMNYGANIALNSGEAALRLELNDPLASKMTALHYFVQSGIDYYGMVSNGANYGNAGGGGHENGRFIAMLFAGILLNNQQMKDFISNSGTLYFGENSMALLNSAGIPVAAQEIEYCGEANYWRVIHDNEAGPGKTCADPYNKIDGGTGPGDAYQQTFSNSAVPGVLAALLLPGGETVYNHPVAVNYLARWVPLGTLTQSDTCAPAPGRCVGGSTPNAACSSANAIYSPGSGPGSGVSFPCPGGGTCSLSTTWPHPQYGVTYGPNGAGGCIQDTNSVDGFGRFPYLHLVGHGRGYDSAFGNAMWALYF